MTLQGLLHNQQTEWRATPVFMKFIAVNGNPVGIVFFILFLYAAIKLFKGNRPLTHCLMLIVSFVGAGFFYAPVLPGIAACLGILLLYSFYVTIRSSKYSWCIPACLALTLVLGIIALRPYFLTISSGIRSDICFFHPTYFYKSAVNFAVALLPLLVIIFIVRKKLFSSTDQTSLIIISIIVITLTSCFLFVHILDSAEYKFFGLAGIGLGLLGGVAFEIVTHKSKYAALALTLVFLLPSVNLYWIYLNRGAGNPVTSAVKGRGVYEKGTEIFVVNPEEAELYQWIKQNTSADQLFIDTTLKLPIFAQRRLLTGIDQPDGKGEVGYSINMDIIATRNGYDKNEFNYRRKIVRNVYGLESTLDRKITLDYLSQRNIMVLLRKSDLIPPFEINGLHELFRSTNANYLIYSTQ